MQFKQNLSLSQSMQQKQVLSPQMIQLFQTFQLGYDQLIEKIDQESQDNVFLDVVRPDRLRFDYLPGPSQSKEGIIDGAVSVDRMGLSVQGSLMDSLQQQLDVLPLRQKDRNIALILLEAIDDRGYLLDYDHVRDRIMKTLAVSSRKVHDILKMIQTFEPDGVAARSLKECLLIQVEAYAFQSESLRRQLKAVIDCHLDDIADGCYDVIQDVSGINQAGVEGLRLFIRENLTHNPGAQFSDRRFTGHVIPSFKVFIEYGKSIIVNLEEEKGIKIGLSQSYEVMLQDPSLDVETKDYLLAQYQKAKTLVEQLQQRKENMARLVSYIVQKQCAFIDNGLFYLQPLLQKTVADYLSVSPSTVSRILSSKYIDTPHGVFSLKILCPRGCFGHTSVQLQQRVRDMCDRYPDLSDAKIAVLLQKEGLSIARRTVNKYRLDGL